MCFVRWGAVALALLGAGAPTSVEGQAGTVLFEDDFEGGLGLWTFPHGSGHELVASGDPGHRTVLSLQTYDRIVVALMRGSEGWGDVRIEGDVLFPEDEHNYLGFVYRYSEVGGRTDLGSLYIKGNGSYIRANPHHDLNVGRTLYEEVRTPLTGEAAIEIGTWQRFALEVVGSDAHLYVGDMDVPQITFPFFEGDQGAFGFKPRNPGGAVWIDALRVTHIDGFSYAGPPLPDIAYETDGMVVDWQVLGPLTQSYAEIETSPFDGDLALRDGDRTVRWRPFETDRRGAVLTGKVTDYEGPRRVAYFHATVTSDTDREVPFGLSTVDNLSLWINGRFLGFLPRSNTAWWDFRTNEEHGGVRGSVQLRAGENHILVRVMGGTYATGGFFMSVGEGGDSGAQDGTSSLLFRLPEHDLYPENIAHDPVSGDYFLGSMSQSRILRIRPDGSYSDFVGPGESPLLLSSVGMKVDAERRFLWVCSGRFSLFADYDTAPPRTGVLQYDIDTGALLGSWMLDQASDFHICNDLAVANGGDVFVTTTLVGAVYRISPGNDEMTLVHQLGEGSHNNGVALSPDERFLFLTVDRTLSRVDLATGTTRTVSAPEEAVIGSDGLYFYDGSLVVVRPRMGGVSQLFLNEALDTVLEARELAYGHPDFAYPTTGVLVGDGLVFVATSYADVPRTPGAEEQHGEVLIHRVALEKR